MRSMSRSIAAATVSVGALLLSGLPGLATAATGGPDESGYSFTDSNEPGGPAAGPFQSIAATGTDVGNHCDECTTDGIKLPFPVSFYGDTTTTVNVSSNGNVQFESSDGTSNATLPNSSLATAMLPLQGDQVTDQPGGGIFTQTLGSAPDRQFVIEWDTVGHDDNSASESYQVVLNENSTDVLFRYLHVSPIAHSVGIQGGDGSNDNYLRYATGSRDVSDGLAVLFTRGRHNTSTTLTASPAAGSVYGQNVTFTAVVKRSDGSPIKPTGTMTFFADDTAIGTSPVAATGKAQLKTKALTADTHVIRATYSGDGAADVSSRTLNYEVEYGPTTTTLSPSSGSIVYGTPLVATVKAAKPGAGSPSGYVTFSFADGTEIADRPLVAGKATYDSSELPPGEYQFVARYDRDANFAISHSAVADLTITKQNSTTSLKAAPNPAAQGKPVKLATTVKRTGKAGAPVGSVTYTIDGADAGTAFLDEKGKATLTLSTLAPGDHTVVATYSGDSNFNSSSSVPVTVRITG